MIMICFFRWRLCYRHQRGSDCCRCPLHSQRAGIYSLTCSYYFYFCMKNLAGTVGTRTHPLSPFPEGSSQSSLGLCLATRLPPLREARGFAPPPHGGLPFSQSTLGGAPR